MKCPYCQTENREGAKFCITCAQSLGTEVVCPQCGHINPQGAKFCEQCARSLADKAPTTAGPSPPQLTSFASGRYQVKKFLGEGGKKKVYLAHDTVLDRDVVFALIKTEKLDETTRGAAALWYRYDEARQYYQETIKVCTEMMFRPELALTRLQLAEILLEHYPDKKKEALEHLDFAIKEFREMKI